MHYVRSGCCHVSPLGIHFLLPSLSKKNDNNLGISRWMHLFIPCFITSETLQWALKYFSYWSFDQSTGFFSVTYVLTTANMFLVAHLKGPKLPSWIWDAWFLQPIELLEFYGAEHFQIRIWIYLSFSPVH